MWSIECNILISQLFTLLAQHFYEAKLVLTGEGKKKLQEVVCSPRQNIAGKNIGKKIKHITLKGISAVIMSI